MRNGIGGICSSGVALVVVVFASAADVNANASGDERTAANGYLDAIRRGQHNWFTKAYNGGKFFQVLANHPDPAKRITLGFDQVINTPRSARFETWGTINDPDCRANPNGGPDICPDPEATGVIGIRKSVGNGAGGSTLYSISCASCHAGFHPSNPPRDLNEPAWANIHPTIGNQYLDSAKVFSANLSVADPRRLIFSGWAKGTVDTTLLFNDNIMNPGVITAFWNVPYRPTFDVGMNEPKVRGGQGGEDDVGGDLAAIRVYTNIGVCFQECVASRPGQPIDLNQCRQACQDFPPQNEVDDLVAFMRSVRSPVFPFWYGWNPLLYYAGANVFARNCASCHGGNSRILSNDEVNSLTADPANASNKCRSLSTNWQKGGVWEQFSSQVYKDRVDAGGRGYRSMPLVGIWATPPFTHTQSIGEWPSPTASVYERGLVYERSMMELLSANRTPKVYRSPVAVGPFPAGTPLRTIFSRDPATGALLCDDAVENRGHYYGSDLRDFDKRALIHWLKFQ